MVQNPQGRVVCSLVEKVEIPKLPTSAFFARLFSPQSLTAFLRHSALPFLSKEIPMESKHDPSLARQMFWSDELKTPGRCPKCESFLENETHVYMIGVREENRIRSFIARNNGGFFCPQCPTIVLDIDTFEKINVEGDTSDQLRDINVAGTVDTRKMSEAEVNALREPSSDIPLVEFLPRPTMR